jgi:hypothetical protein
MKKLLLASTSAFVVALATPALAGGSSSVYQSQTGNKQQSTIDQSSATNGQVGTSAHPFVQQNGNGSGQNIISITQTGTDDAFGATEQSWQSGSKNNATILQENDKNDIVLQQTGNNNGSTSGSIHQSANSAALRDPNGNNKAKLTQTGDSNQFYITQYNTNAYTEARNSALASQNGNNNTLSIVQYGQGDSVNLQQYNNGNIFISDQGGVVHGAYAAAVSAVQVSDASIGNKIESYQEDGSYSKLYVTLQQGHSNSIYNNQKGANTARVNLQNGHNNQITNQQNAGWGSTATYYQDGSNLIANSTQTGGGVKLATITQVGSLNSAYLIQSGSASTADLTQTGSNSYAYVTQTGVGSGLINSVVGTQTGTGAQNQAYVSQASYSNTANYSQNGSGNYTNIKQ